MTTQAVTKTMKSALFYEPGVVRYEDVPIPQPDAGEIVIQIDTALTCGTDVKCYRRGHPVLLKNFPSPFGHECSGVVYAIGDGVNRFEIGDRVAAANSAPCYACFYCRKGKYNLCEHLDLLNGAYAEYLKIPAQIVARNTLKVPDHVSLEAAAFTEPLAMALRGVEMSEINSGDRVAVIGLGPIGQLLVKAAKNRGAHVTAFGRSPRKLHTAIEFGGADAVVNMTESVSIPEIGYDVVIEAVGKPEVWQLAVNLVRKGGVVNLFGGCKAGTTVEFDTRRLHYDEITLIGMFHHTPMHFRQALEAMASCDIDPAGLITHAMPMAEFEQALQMVESGEALKVALKP